MSFEGKVLIATGGGSGIAAATARRFTAGGGRVAVVDLVATGRTLEENDLEVRAEIVECTARFVANRVSHKLRAREVDGLTAKLRQGLGR